MIICGDFNARIGEKQHCQFYDDVSQRKALDIVTNRQGDLLLNFVNDIKGCILNGRKSVEYDDFASVTSYRGKAVVDYFISRQNDYNSVSKLYVTSCVEIVSKLHAEHLLSDVSRLPDHNLVSIEIEMSQTVKENMIVPQLV